MEDKVKDRIVLYLGKNEDGKIISEFLSKYDDSRWNLICREVLGTVVKLVGTDWDPKIDGYPFLKGLHNPDFKSDYRPPTGNSTVKEENPINTQDEAKNISPDFIEKKTLDKKQTSKPPKFHPITIAEDKEDLNLNEIVPIKTGMKEV